MKNHFWSKAFAGFLLCAGIVVCGAVPMKKFASGSAGALLVQENYLYAAIQGKLHTYDISVPGNPRLLSSADAAGNRQMVKAGKYLYLSCRASGVQVFSLDDPARPRSVNRFYPAELATGLAVSGDVLAVTLRVYGVEFFDISNPLQIRSLGLLRTKEAQSAEFFGKGRIAIGDWGAREVAIADVRNFDKLKVSRRISLDGYADGVMVQGKYLFAATGMHSPVQVPDYQGRGNGLEIFDISDLKNIVRSGSVKFDRTPKMFPDWWSVKVSGNYAFVGNSVNGVFVVDVTDKKNPVTLHNVKIPGDAVSQVAVGNGAVYFSGHRSGLYLLEYPGAKAVVPEKSEVNLPVRKNSAMPEVPGLKNLPLPGFVWSLDKWNDMLYAACGSGGAREFEITPDGKLIARRVFPGSAMDCAVSEKLFIIAADSELKIFDRKSGKLLSSTPAGSRGPFLQLRLYGDVLCTGGRSGAFTLWKISTPEKPVVIGKFSGGGILYHDMLPERAVKNLFPVNWHSRFPRWYNAGAGKEVAALSGFSRCSNQTNGITEIGGKFYLIARKGVLCLDPVVLKQAKLLPMVPLNSGIPTSDGNLIALSNRRTGRIYFYNFDGKRFTMLRKRNINLSFAVPGRVIFHNRKAFIPAGLCGIYYER